MTPNIFISHRWEEGEDYKNLVAKFEEYGFEYLDYSVPIHDPLDLNKVNEIRKGLKEQVRQCNYFITFANLGMANSDWCKFEIQVAHDYGKPILSIKPFGYSGSVPSIIQQSDSQDGPVGFHTPSIIRKICKELKHPLPKGVEL